MSCIVLFMLDDAFWQLNLLFLISLVFFVYTCVARPYSSILLMAHTIINEIGVMILIGECYPFLTVYHSDALFYWYGQIVIGTIAAIIWINMMMFIISFLIALCEWLKRCPHCLCCKLSRLPAEKMFADVRNYLLK